MFIVFSTSLSHLYHCFYGFKIIDVIGENNERLQYSDRCKD